MILFSGKTCCKHGWLTSSRPTINCCVIEMHSLAISAIWRSQLQSVKRSSENSCVVLRSREWNACWSLQEEIAAVVLLLKTLKPVAKTLWANPQQHSGAGCLTKLTDTVHHCDCTRVCTPVCITLLLGSASRPTEDGRKSSTALHHMPNMRLPANLWGILASASKAEFLTEGDE